MPKDNKEKLHAVERLAVEVIDNLPDSRADRRDLLLTVLAALPENSDVRKRAMTMLDLMKVFDCEQRELVLDFRNTQQKANGN